MFCLQPKSSATTDLIGYIQIQGLPDKTPNSITLTLLGTLTLETDVHKKKSYLYSRLLTLAVHHKKPGSEQPKHPTKNEQHQKHHLRMVGSKNYCDWVKNPFVTGKKKKKK